MRSARTQPAAKTHALGAAEAAVAHGLQFLLGAVAEHGGWPCREYRNRELVGPGTDEFPPFVAGLGLLALVECDDPVAERLRVRTRAFLHGCVEYPGVWRYRPRIAPDLDDTAICSLAAAPHLWLLLGRNVELLLSLRDGQGRFRTWIQAPDGHAADSVVNANVIAYLGDRPETRAVQRWLQGLVEQPRGHDLALRYYPFPLDLYVALARASSLAPPVFAALRATLAERILACRDAGGEFGDTLRTAQALTALDRLNADGPRPAGSPGRCWNTISPRPRRCGCPRRVCS